MIYAKRVRFIGGGHEVLEEVTFSELSLFVIAAALLSESSNYAEGLMSDGVRQCEVCDAYYLSTDPDSRTCGDDCDQEAEDNNRLHADDDLSDWGASDGDPYDRELPQF